MTPFRIRDRLRKFLARRAPEEEGWVDLPHPPSVRAAVKAAVEEVRGLLPPDPDPDVAPMDRNEVFAQFPAVEFELLDGVDEARGYYPMRRKSDGVRFTLMWSGGGWSFFSETGRRPSTRTEDALKYARAATPSQAYLTWFILEELAARPALSSEDDSFVAALDRVAAFSGLPDCRLRDNEQIGLTAKEGRIHVRIEPCRETGEVERAYSSPGRLLVGLVLDFGFPLSAAQSVALRLLTGPPPRDAEEHDDVIIGGPDDTLYATEREAGPGSGTPIGRPEPRGRNGRGTGAGPTFGGGRD